MNHELKDGFTELWNNPNIFYLVKVVSVIMFAGGAIFVAFPIFVHHHYGVMAHGLAILISSLGGGLFLGAVSIARSSKILDHKVLFSWSITIVAILFYAGSRLRSSDSNASATKRCPELSEIDKIRTFILLDLFFVLSAKRSQTTEQTQSHLTSK
jgi:hypothetical protein